MRVRRQQVWKKLHVSRFGCTAREGNTVSNAVPLFDDDKLYALRAIIVMGMGGEFGRRRDAPDFGFHGTRPGAIDIAIGSKFLS